MSDMHIVTHDLRNAARLEELQIDRFIRSGMSAENFLDDPHEEEVTAEILRCKKRHAMFVLRQMGLAPTSRRSQFKPDSIDMQL